MSEVLFKPGSFVRTEVPGNRGLGVVIAAKPQMPFGMELADAYLIQPIESNGDRFYAKVADASLVDLASMQAEAYRGVFNRAVRRHWSIMNHGNGLTGTDPEIFAFDAGGEVIPAWKWLGTKKESASTIYWDGVQSEFTVEPKVCHEFLTDNIQARMTALFGRLMAHNRKAILRAQDVVELDEKTLELSADEHINLGCSPSRNIYEDIKPIEIGDPRTHKFRYAGTHLHFSYAGTCVTQPDWWPHGVIALIDKIGGVALTAMGRDVENPIRRKAYGRPGEYRIPGENNFRLEYRTPGAYLLQHPAIFNFAADLCRAAYRLGFQFDGRRDEILPNSQYKDIILNCDADAALKYMNENKAVFDLVLKHSGTIEKDSSIIQRTWQALTSGIKAFGVYDSPVHENWMLTTGQWELQNKNPGRNWSRFCDSHIS